MIKIGELNFYLAEELADKLNLKIATIRGFIRQGKLKAKKIGRKNYISEEDFLKFMSQKIDYHGEPLEKYENLAEATINLYNYFEKNKTNKDIKKIIDIIDKSKIKCIFIELKHNIEIIDILKNSSQETMDMYIEKYYDKIENVRTYIYQLYDYKDYTEIKEINKLIENNNEIKEMCKKIEYEMDAILIANKLQDLEKF